MFRGFISEQYRDYLYYGYELNASGLNFIKKKLLQQDKTKEFAII